MYFLLYGYVILNHFDSFIAQSFLGTSLFVTLYHAIRDRKGAERFPQPSVVFASSTWNIMFLMLKLSHLCVQTLRCDEFSSQSDRN